MKLSLLLEGISSTVYHITSPRNALKILVNDSFKLKESSKREEGLEKSDKPVPRKRSYYLSTARSRAGGYLRSFQNSTGEVIFELDGRKLSTRYPGKPYDDFKNLNHEERNKQVPHWVKGEKEKLKIRMELDETEDRIYSAKPKLEKAREYIKAIHEFNDEKHNKTEAEKFRLELKKISGDIPVYSYSDRSSFELLFRRKSKRL